MVWLLLTIKLRVACISWKTIENALGFVKGSLLDGRGGATDDLGSFC